MDSQFHSSPSHGFSLPPPFIKPLPSPLFPHLPNPDTLLKMSSSSKRPSFSGAGADAGLASIAGDPFPHRPFLSKTSPLRILPFSPRPISIPGRISNTHFLDSCHLCKKALAGNRDIFMYRGDLPFCSEECRSEQMEMDEAMEKSRLIQAASVKVVRSKKKSHKCPLPAGIAAA